MGGGGHVEEDGPHHEGGVEGQAVPVKDQDLFPGGEPGEGEGGQAEEGGEDVHPALGLQKPAPDGPGDHEGEGHGEEEDRAEEAFPPGGLVHREGEEEAQAQASGHEEEGEEDEVHDALAEADVHKTGEELAVVLQAHEAELGP